jgi:hypothetical protein
MAIVIGDASTGWNDLSKEDQKALKLADERAPAAGSFSIDGKRDHYSYDDVHAALFGFSLRSAFTDRRLERLKGAKEEQDTETAQRIFALFKYNVSAMPLSTAVDGVKFATLDMGIPRSIVEVLGVAKTRKVLQDEMVAFLTPFQDAAAFWRVAPMIEDKGDVGMAIYARVHLMLAHEYEMLLPMGGR